MTAPTIDTTPAEGQRPGAAPPDRRARAGWVALAAHAVIAFAFPLLSAPGQLAADTKIYLYLDPSRMLSRATSMWDPTVAAGTVPHQNIGYLFPMGPYYWLAERAGVPDWVAQRIWIGLVSMAAAVGVHWLLRTLDPTGDDVGPGGRFVAAAAYQLSPYLLVYVARHSVLLGAWAALPWLCTLTLRSLRERGWRWPACFAVVLALVGSINASSLVFVLLGSLLILVWATLTRQAAVGRVVTAALQIGGLSALVSVWWIVGLRLQAAYGIDVLRYTESPVTVAGTSTALESMRQLGYWFFYGSELVFPFTPQAAPYQEQPALLIVGFALPTLALAAAVLTRWRWRGLAMLLVALGLLVAVGAHPWGGPALFGRALQRFFETSAGLALRSTPRAIPLLALGIALLLGAGVAAVGRLRPAWRPWVVGLVVAVVAVNLYPWLTGGLIAAAQRMPAEPPAWWQEAAAELSARDDGTRALVLPGTDFAAYRWGFALEPVLPGLTDRPTLQRENVPYGTEGTVDLLMALDRRLQEGVLDPAAVVPIARRLAAGDVVIQHDLAYERYPTPRPRDLWVWEQEVPGLGSVLELGGGYLNEPERALRDAEEYAGLGRDDPPALSLYRVEDALPIARAAAGPPLVLAGDGEGMVDAAAVGLLDRPGVVLYAAALTPEELDQALTEGADLVVTDTNRQRGLRWGGMRDNHGPTVAPGEEPLRDDPYAQDLSPFADRSPATRTVAERVGVARVEATSAGQPLWYTPEDRPANAIDGDARTDWRVVAFESVEGERLRITLGSPVTTDRVTLLQTITLPRQQIFDVTLRFDGGDEVDVALDARSLAEPGQEITFPERTFRQLEVELGRTSAPFDVGLAEVRIPGVQAEEVLRLPTDLASAAGEASLDHRFVVLLTRERTDPRNEFRRDEELAMRRRFELPVGRAFDVGGTIRLDADGADDVLDRALGFRSAEEGGMSPSAYARMPGNPRARARAAFDGDPTTAWRSPLDPVQPWVAVRLPAPVTIDHLDLVVVADGRHSVPTELVLSTPEGDRRTVPLPSIADGEVELATATVTVPVDPPLVTNDVKATVTGLRPLLRDPRGGEDPVVLPVAIAELGVPGVVSEPAPASLPDRCLPGQVLVDDTSVGLRVRGSVDDALDLRGLDAEPCDPATGAPFGPLTLGAGSHTVRTADPITLGFAVDQLVLGSDRGGEALTLGPRGLVPPPAEPAAPPSVVVERQEATELSLRVEGARQPFELVLGQSWSEGWRASVDGATLASDAPRLVDGYANGWRLTPDGGDGPISVTLRWEPQRLVPPALAVSAAGFVLCLALALLPRRRRAPDPFGTESSPNRRHANALVATREAWGSESTSNRCPKGAAAEVAGSGGGAGAPTDTAVATTECRPIATVSAIVRVPTLDDHAWVPARTAWLLALATAAASLLAMTWWAAPLAGLLVGLSLRVRILRPILLAGPLLLATAGAGVVAGQVLFAPQAGYGWPGLFDPLDTLVWLAVVLTLVEVGLTVVSARRRAVNPPPVTP